MTTQIITVEVTENVVTVQPITGVKGEPGGVGVGLPWISLTQAQFDALSPPDPDTIYDITDA